MQTGILQLTSAYSVRGGGVGVGLEGLLSLWVRKKKSSQFYLSDRSIFGASIARKEWP